MNDYQVLLDRQRLNTNYRALVSGAVLLTAAFAVLPPTPANAADVSGSNEITVKPGDTGTCAVSPCRIHLVMPPGDGEHEVIGNEVKIGDYPAGETVDLGNYFAPQALAVKGAGVPKAYVYMPEDL